MSTDFYSLKICLVVWHPKKSHGRVAQFVEIVSMREDHQPCQPTIAAQLLLKLIAREKE
jgi:hypothetical protein